MAARYHPLAPMIINSRYALGASELEPENSQFPGSRTAISGLRYYSPSLGRFVNRDPSDEGGGLNLYANCTNNLINAVDFLGRWPVIFVTAHQNITYRVATVAGATSTFATVAANTAAWVDSLQQNSFQFLHSMTAQGLSNASSVVAGTAFIISAIENARDALGAGRSLDAAAYFGFAAHPVQDFTSPPHYPFALWNPALLSAINHVTSEFFDPGSGSSADRATEIAWGWTFQGGSPGSSGIYVDLNNAIFGGRETPGTTLDFNKAFDALSPQQFVDAMMAAAKATTALQERLKKSPYIYSIDFDHLPNWLSSSPAASAVYFAQITKITGSLTDLKPANAELINQGALADAFRARNAFDGLSPYLTGDAPMFALPPMLFKAVAQLKAGLFSDAYFTKLHYEAAVESQAIARDKLR